MSQHAEPVDLTHLDRYTGGERAINEEVLRLFQNSCQDILAKLEALAADATNPVTARLWHEAAHTLKGASRGIGAFELADAAEEAEEGGSNDRLAVIASLEQLRIKSEPVLAFIQDFLGGRE
jgi:HPt (histidine-containing phosphotransfer) domain-containing protein